MGNTTRYPLGGERQAIVAHVTTCVKAERSRQRCAQREPGYRGPQEVRDDLWRGEGAAQVPSGPRRLG